MIDAEGESALNFCIVVTCTVGVLWTKLQHRLRLQPAMHHAPRTSPHTPESERRSPNFQTPKSLNPGALPASCESESRRPQTQNPNPKPNNNNNKNENHKKNKTLIIMKKKNPCLLRLQRLQSRFGSPQLSAASAGAEGPEQGLGWVP